MATAATAATMTMTTMTKTCRTWDTLLSDNGTSGAMTMTTAASLSPSLNMLPSQLLIRFQNRTFVWNNERDADDAVDTAEDLHSQACTSTAADIWNAVILSFISDRTGWPVRYLQLQLQLQQPENNYDSMNSNNDNDTTMINVTVISNILGGKGGFGTLLKNSSRVSKTTSQDFGACRDLQGRRLRHVNDAAGYQQWKEWNDKVKAGTATEEEMAHALLFGTDSGVAGWHLQLPSWGDSGAGASKQMNRQHARQLRLWKREKQAAVNVKEQKKQQTERDVQSYVAAAVSTSSRVQESLQTALQEGLLSQKQAAAKAAANVSNKRARLEPDPPVAFCTLAGELVMGLADSKTSATTSSSATSSSTSSPVCWQMQGTSNFATMGMILNKVNTNTATAKASDSSSTDNDNYYYYYEVRLVTGGLAQIGWATAPAAPATTVTATAAAAAAAATGFQPNSDNGEGAGDDAFSWAYDPSRELYLHNGKEQALKVKQRSGASGAGPAAAGDVIGCAYKYAEASKKGTVQFYCNGKPVGKEMDVATDTDSDTSTSIMLYPAISCNQGEILELRVDRDTLSYLPKGAQPVGELLASPEVLDELDDDDDDDKKVEESPQDSKLHEDNDRNLDSKVPALEPESTKAILVTLKASPTVVTPEALDLGSYTSVEELQSLGLDRLKAGLMAAGLKCGGTLEERAARLFSIKGLSMDQYPAKLLAKRKKM